jgi:hypothetical protein
MADAAFGRFGARASRLTRGTFVAANPVLARRGALMRKI